MLLRTDTQHDKCTHKSAEVSTTLLYLKLVMLMAKFVNQISFERRDESRTNTNENRNMSRWRTVAKEILHA